MHIYESPSDVTRFQSYLDADNRWIGGRDYDGSLYVTDYTAEGGSFVSATTSRHVNLVRRSMALFVKVYGGSGVAYPQPVGQTPAASESGFRFFRPEVPNA